MIAPPQRPLADGPGFDGLALRDSRMRRRRHRLLSFEPAGPSRWQRFLDDRRAIRFKWGLLALLLLAAALLDLPL